VKTLLIDDHALFREGLSMLMEQRFPEVELRQAGDLNQALRCLAQEPDISLVLLDLGLRDSQGADSVHRLRQAHPELTVVVLSADERPETVLAAIHHGAAGFIPKTARGGAIEQALRVVLADGIYLPATVYGGLPQPSLEAAAGSPTERAIADLDLSPRQVDVLRLLAQGLPNKLICRQLDLAESSVKTHMLGLFRKLQVGSRTEAVLAAARLGLHFEPMAAQG
jgi:DNA-binding NarL/FixJ family response regulator